MENSLLHPRVPLIHRRSHSSSLPLVCCSLQFSITREASVRCSSSYPASSSTLRSCSRNQLFNHLQFSKIYDHSVMHSKQPWLHLLHRGDNPVRNFLVKSNILDAGMANIGPSHADQELDAKFRGMLFYIVTSVAALILIIPMLLQHPLVLLLDKYRRKAHHFIAKTWAQFTVFPFLKIQVAGLENLPPGDDPAVYVSNHQSFLDIYALLTLGISFKFISKISIFRYPVIGWAMHMMGVVPLKRMDGRSQLECLKKCIELVNNGSSVFFFPEGTRSKDGKLGDFKKGAFSIATKTGAPVVPLAIMGSGNIMPSGKEAVVNNGSIKITILKPLAGNDPQALCQEARRQIAVVLDDRA